MNIKTAVLNELLDMYSSRDSFYAPGSKSQKVVVNRRDKLFDSLRNKLELEEEMHALEKTGFVTIEWVNEEFMSATLIKDEATIKKLFAYLDRPDPREEIARQRALLSKWADNPSYVVSSFANAMLEKTENKRPTTSNFYSSIEQLEKILVALEAISNLKVETYYRNLSMKLFGNSKELENLSPKLNSLFREFDEAGYDVDEDPLLAHGLIKNPVEVRLKGPIAIQVANQVVDLAHWPGFFGLNDAALEKCAVIGGSAKRVVTIENLTSFTTFEDPEAVIVYLAGFHDSVKQSLLKKIHEAFPDIPFYHFGDMDSGGFYIFHSLKTDTRIPFVPLNMDVEAFRKVERFALPLSDNDRKRLAIQLKDDGFAEFHPLIKLMLEEGKKVEQEAFIALSDD